MVKKILTFIILTGIIVSGTSCGLIGIIASPTRHEQKIPAEFRFDRSKDVRVAVFAKQPVQANIGANLSYYVTKAVNIRFAKKTKLQPEQIMDYEDIAELAGKKPHLRWMEDEKLIDLFGVDFLMIIDIERFNLDAMTEEGYYKGKLDGNCYLLSRQSGGRVWPGSEKSRRVTVGFELGPKGRTAALKRLADSYAHCLVRYFYNCPKDRFNTGDDMNRTGWKQWPD